MGSITRGLSNNITTGGVILPAGITNASVADVTSFANASGGTLVLLSTQTASDSASISFTTGLDSTYDEYIFKFINIHTRTEASPFDFSFNMSTDGGSNYNVTKTTTAFRAYHSEGGLGGQLQYTTGFDLAQSTDFQPFGDQAQGSDADQCTVGELTLFNPSSTTYVKHFLLKSNDYNLGDYSVVSYVAGYCNTTSAVNAIRFKMPNSNFDGIIKLYGVKKS
jgi:hypothetical protein